LTVRRGDRFFHNFREVAWFLGAFVEFHRFSDKVRESFLSGERKGDGRAFRGED
jgi:hypothetical protein